MANNPTEDGAALKALLEALKSLDASSTPLYSDYVLAALEATAPGALEKFMMLKNYEYKSETMRRPYREGREEGRTEGRIDAILGVLEERGIPVPEDVRARIDETTDLELLDTWVRRAVRATKAEDLFEDSSGIGR